LIVSITEAAEVELSSGESMKVEMRASDCVRKKNAVKRGSLME
jgi:hypothetical protein